MSLHKKVVGALLAGALLGSTAMSGEKPRTADPVVQSQPAQKQQPPKAREQSPPPKASGSHARPQQPRDAGPSHRPNTPRPPVITAPHVGERHRPGYDVKNRHDARWDSRHHQNSCRYDPWWQHRWNHWDTPRFSVWAGWPYWSTWGWEDRHAYRAYERSGSVDTFEVMPPLGYERAVVAYFRSANDDTIRVELERPSPWGGIELSVLRDDGADGDLENAILASGRNRDEALANYQRDGGNRMLMKVADRLYDQMYEDIRDEVRDRN